MTPEQATALAASTADIAVLFRLASAPVVRFWSGVGPFPLPSDAIEPGGATYYGVGALTGFPEVSQLINGIAERVDVVVSGTDPRMAALADADADAVRGADVRLGLLPLDATGQPINTALWFRSYTADTIAISKTSDDTGKQIITVSLSIGSAFVRRRRPQLSFFSDMSQRLRSATDRFCERTGLYAQGVTKKWPI